MTMPPSSGMTIVSDVRQILPVDHRVFTDRISYASSIRPGPACVGTAASAAEGIAMAVELHPEVIMTDIETPRQDGGPPPVGSVR